MGYALNTANNILGAGYSGPMIGAHSGRSGQVFCGRGGAVLGEKLGGSRAVGGLVAIQLALLENGGFLRFLIGAALGVGRVESEGSRQGRGFLRFLADRRKLGRLSGLDLGGIDEGGGAPLDPRRPDPIRVAHVSAGPDENNSDAVAICDIRPLLDAGKGGEGHKIPLTPMGSGVRATQSAGLNSQSACRPRNFASMVKGGGYSPSCAFGLNKLRMLGRGWAGVN